MSRDHGSWRGGRDRKSTASEEERYESLSSLGRLVETDMETVIKTNRRLVLPVIDVKALVTPPAQQHNPGAVNDYVNELMAARRQLIQRLVPDVTTGQIEAQSPRTNVKEIIKQSSDRTGGNDTIPTSHLKYDIVIDTHSAMDNSVDDTETMGTDTALGDTDDTNLLTDTISALRDRLAKFEATSNTKRSVHADDFQEYLGTRYLELYKKRAKESKCSPNNSTNRPITDDNYGNPTGSTSADYSLNAKLHHLARSHHRKRETEETPALPPIEYRKRPRRPFRCRMYNSNGISATNGMMPIYNDMNEEGSKNSTRGIPSHTERRAKMRYIISNGLHTILTELRRRSSSIDKTEPKQVVNAIDSDVE